MNLFNRKPKPPKPGEQTPQLTVAQRSQLLTPSAPTGGLPYRTYDQMMGDSMVQTVLTIKRLGVLAAEWTVEPSQPTAEARKRAAFVLDAFERMEGSPTTVLAQAMDAFAKGWSVQEKVFEPAAGKVWLKAVRAKDPSLFGLQVDRFGQVEQLLLQIPGDPTVKLDRAKFVLYANRASYADPKGRSDLDAAYRHWQAKQDLLSAWKFHLSRFAMPTLLGRFQRGLAADDRDHILTALTNLQENDAIVFPNEIDVSTLGGDKEPGDAFLSAIDFHNREIARAVLGQTLTTDEGRRVGSLALGKVHLQVLLLQMDAVRRELADTVMTEQVVRPLVELNFGTGPIPRFKFAQAASDVFATGKLG